MHRSSIATRLIKTRVLHPTVTSKSLLLQTQVPARSFAAPSKLGFKKFSTIGASAQDQKMEHQYFGDLEKHSKTADQSFEKHDETNFFEDTSESEFEFEKKAESCYVEEPREDVVTEKARSLIAAGQKDSFFVMDLQSVRDRVSQWKSLLPQVEIFYSFKTNSDPEIIKTMLEQQSNFDCASKEEIRTAIGLGVNPKNIIYANPCKMDEHLEFARDNGVNLMTFDCAEEAENIAEIHPNAELILRITVDDSNAPDPMSEKFGAHEDYWSNILDTCKNLGLRVRGVSFHVGSGGCSFVSYRESILNAKKVFEMAEQKGMQDMDILDIGGGFSMSSEHPENNFDVVAPQIQKMLSQEFPGPNKNIRVIGEPGRNMTQDSMALAVKVFLARQHGPNCRHYFVNNGIYQGFGCQIFENLQHFKGQPLLTKSEYQNRINQEQRSYIWGQTCDGVDWLTKNKPFPYMKKGEWIIYRNIGAYGYVVATTFNGYQIPQIHYLI